MNAQAIIKDAGAEIASNGADLAFRRSIGIIREGATASRRIFAEPAVKAWCVRRFRHLFLREAVEDPVALEAASVRNDPRPPRQRIAERFLAEGAAEAWPDEQPDPVERYLPATTLLVCPGLLNGLLPEREFRDDLPRIEWRYRLRALRAASHPARSCAANVADILRAIDEGRGSDAAARAIPDDELGEPPGDVLVIGYSKGAPDVLATLVHHPRLRSQVQGVFTWAGAIGGSQVADDLATRFKNSPVQSRAADIALKLRGFAHSVMTDRALARHRIDEFDTAGAIRDLTTPVRQAFLREHGAAIDALDIPIFTFRGVTRLEEVPLSQRGGCRLLSTFEEGHDMQVAASCSQLAIPMATELAVFHGHHWDLAYPAFSKRRWLNNTYHPFPKTAALAAMVQLAAELGLAE